VSESSSERTDPHPNTTSRLGWVQRPMRNQLLTGFLCLVSAGFGLLGLQYEGDYRVQAAGLGILAAVLVVVGCWSDRSPRSSVYEQEEW